MKLAIRKVSLENLQFSHRRKDSNIEMAKFH